MKCDVVVVGAGVVGLAVAANLAEDREVVLIESHGKFGQETSSRNSEVVHSGIHYPQGSRKTELCLRGRDQLYAFCAARGVPASACGKLVVATADEEIDHLEKLAAHSFGLGVPHEFLTGEEIRRREPRVRAKRGLFFPKTGIVDSHRFMAALEILFLERGGAVAYHHRVTGVEHAQDWKLRVHAEEQVSEIEASVVVNASGLAAAELTSLALATARYEHRYCRGRYFMLSSAFDKNFSSLIYPVPQKHGLGVHVTLDMEGRARLGPDVDWCETSRYDDRHRWYDCDWDEARPAFLSAVRRYCDGVEERDLSPGLIGIRSKLFLDGKAHPDFLIENHGGWVHCLGIESPGLTASLAIADEVRKLI